MRASWKRPILLAGLYGLLSVAFCWGLFEFPNGLGTMDWDEKLFYYGSVLKSAIEYGQLPFWNPWHCGGDVLWQNPQVELLSPVYLLATAMPLALAIKVNIVLHYWVAFIGMHLLLTEVIGLSFLPLVIYLASAFTLSGAPALHVAVGHSVLLPMFYLPLQLYFLLRSFKTGAVRDALVGGAILALMIYNGGQHVVVMAVSAIGILATAAAFTRWSWRPVVLAAALGVSGVVYAAPKLLPVTLFVANDRFTDQRSAVVHPDRMTADMLLRAYRDPDPARDGRDPVQQWGWYEYGNYLGWLAPLLILASFTWILWKARGRDAWLGVSLALTALLMLAWSAGEFSAFAPASIAGHLPFFSRFRVPSRYAVMFGLFAAVMVGWTLKAMAIETARGAKLFVGVVCALASLQLLVVNRGNLDSTFYLPPLEHGFRLLQGPRTLANDRTSNPFGPNSPMLVSLMNGVAFDNCYEPFQYVRTADTEKPVVYATGDAKIVDLSFTPNRIDFSVIAGRAPSAVVFNENYGPGWRSTAGPIVLDRLSGKPSVTLSPGQTGKFSFVFFPPGLLLGLAILGAAVVASPFVWKLRLPDPGQKG